MGQFFPTALKPDLCLESQCGLAIPMDVVASSLSIATNDDGGRGLATGYGHSGNKGNETEVAHLLMRPSLIERAKSLLLATTLACPTASERFCINHKYSRSKMQVQILYHVQVL